MMEKFILDEWVVSIVNIKHANIPTTCQLVWYLGSKAVNYCTRDEDDVI